MIWSVGNSGARLLRVESDEAEGSLSIWVMMGGAEREIVYEGMFCSQLDGSVVGITITSVAIITPEELTKPIHERAAALLYEECGADDAFLRDMYRRGNHLYAHYTRDGGVYIVLARRQAFGDNRAFQQEN